MDRVGVDAVRRPRPRPRPDARAARRSTPNAIEEFCRAIVDATADLVCAFKPQIAYFASQGEEPALERICTYIRSEYPDVTLILDAKRGDIGSTAEHYAREAFVPLRRPRRHGQPVHGHRFGRALLRPRRRGARRSVARATPAATTSNRSIAEGRPLYAHVADMVRQPVVEARRLWPRRRCHLSGRAGRRAGDRARPADPRARRRRAGRRRGARPSSTVRRATDGG